MQASERTTPLELGSLAAVLVLAAALRLYHLPQRGLIYWDEAKFALEGIRLEVALRHLLAEHGPVIAGKAIGTAKPTHALLIALFILAGEHDYTPLLMSALASLLQVALVFFLARRLFGPPIALLSAALLAISEYDVIYARSGLSESDGTMFLTAGVLLWLARGEGLARDALRIRSSAWLPIQARSASWGFSTADTFPTFPWGLFLAGLLFGVGFTTNYRLIVYITSLVGFDLLWIWHEAGWTEAFRRIVPWGLGLLTVPALWQLADVLVRARGLALFRSEVDGKPRWYVSEILYQLHGGNQGSIQFDPLPYIHWYVLREGIPVFVLVLLGLLLTLWRHSFPWLAMAVPVVVPYLVYLFAPFVEPRNLAATLPFASILAAAALKTIVFDVLAASRTMTTGWQRQFLSSVLLVVLSLALAGLGAAMSWRLTPERSGYAQAAQYVQHHGHGRVLASSEVMVFYLRGSGRYCDAPPLRGTLAQLSADVRAGYQYAVLDHFSWQAARFVRDRMPSVAHYSTVGPIAIGENPVDSERYAPSNHTWLSRVDVFRLDARRLPSPDGAQPATCNRDRV